MQLPKPMIWTCLNLLPAVTRKASALPWHEYSSPHLVPRSLMALLPERSLQKRDPCNQEGATYVLYKEYDQNDCVARNPSNYGDCFPLHELEPIVDTNPTSGSCAIFCQQTVTFTYGQEIILPLSICHHPFTCTVTNTITKTSQITWTFQGQGSLTGEITPKWKPNFLAGVSYAYLNAEAKTNTQSLTVTPLQGECGYFSFLPHIITTCGLFAGGTGGNPCPAPQQHYNPTSSGCSSDFVNIVDANGETRHQGATVFVYTDCSTNAPIECGSQPQQDEAWCQPGVALPRSAAISALSAMPTVVDILGVTATVTETFSDPSPTVVYTSDFTPQGFTTATATVPSVIPTPACQTWKDCTSEGFPCRSTCTLICAEQGVPITPSTPGMCGCSC